MMCICIMGSSTNPRWSTSSQCCGVPAALSGPHIVYISISITMFSIVISISITLSDIIIIIYMSL